MNNIKTIREELGLTQTDLAKVLQEIDSRIDTSMICRFEQGICLPTSKMAESLANLLQTDLKNLFDEDELFTIENQLSDLETYDELREVASKIPFGKECAISRDRLVDELGLSDRRVRDLIEDARRKGYFILNDQDGVGYYQVDDTDLDSLERAYKQIKRRGRSILSTGTPIRRVLVAAGREV